MHRHPLAHLLPVLQSTLLECHIELTIKSDTTISSVVPMSTSILQKTHLIKVLHATRQVKNPKTLLHLLGVPIIENSHHDFKKSLTLSSFTIPHLNRFNLLHHAQGIIYVFRCKGVLCTVDISVRSAAASCFNDTVFLTPTDSLFSILGRGYLVKLV
jgi:hypothetical protein